MEPSERLEDLLNENKELRYQLEEATDTIDAIRNGHVDALVMKAPDGHQLYTLKNADQTYRVFIEQMAEGAITLNEDGIILYSNSRFAHMMDIPLEKVIGLSFKTFVAAVSRDKYVELIANGWKGNIKDEIILTDTEGQQKPYLLSCNTLDLDEGLSLSVIVSDLSSQKENQRLLRLKNHQLEIAQEITKKLYDKLEIKVKERTEELYHSREHFKFLADNIPQMIWTNLPNGEINFYNKQWYDYTGLPSDIGFNEGWRIVIHPDDQPDTSLKYWAAINGGHVYVKENRYKRQSDGTYRWHLNRGIPLKNEQGEIILWIGTATDIEDQKQEMDKKDEFIGIASHELKTPLTSLKGYLQIISNYKKEPLPETVKGLLVKANEALNKLQYLVNDLLDVSKINAGRLEYSMDRLTVANLVKTATDNAGHIYPNYIFDSTVEENLSVTGNAERLEQVLSNLIGNAVKYSKNNNHIMVKAARHGNFARVTVIDKGIGLTEEQQEKIFDRFYRVEDKKFLTSGLGMGLYICSEIIKTHGGNIGVNSVFGNGSSFYFELPVNADDDNSFIA
jgi:two-component system phosphate regulon sensor histidine kinase PhoR